MKAVRDNATYKAHMRSPEWRAFRREIVTARGGKCEICQAWGRLDVHHLTYERLGCERPEDVLVVCRECHEALHGRFDAAERRVRRERSELVAKYRKSVREAREARAREVRRLEFRARVLRSVDGEPSVAAKVPNPNVRRRAMAAAPAA